MFKRLTNKKKLSKLPILGIGTIALVSGLVVLNKKLKDKKAAKMQKNALMKRLKLKAIPGIEKAIIKRIKQK